MIEISEQELQRLTRFMKKNFGIDLSRKQSLVVGRLQNLLIQRKFRSFHDFCGYVERDRTGEAAALLVNKLTTNHTYFMREPAHFDYFAKKVLPYLVETEAKNKDLRIWSAGCSSGEEPYTLAMIIDNFFGSNKDGWDTRILATDISTQALEQGIRGVYTQEDIRQLSPLWQQRYFQKGEGRERIIKDFLKKEVIFRKFNLMSELFPFRKKFHVIFCRNVMIYFDADTRHRLVERFYDWTEPGGYLFIGHSESLTRGKTGYQHVIPSVYRKPK